MDWHDERLMDGQYLTRAEHCSLEESNTMKSPLHSAQPIIASDTSSMCKPGVLAHITSRQALYVQENLDKIDLPMRCLSHPGSGSMVLSTHRSDLVDAVARQPSVLARPCRPGEGDLRIATCSEGNLILYCTNHDSIVSRSLIYPCRHCRTGRFLKMQVPTPASAMPRPVSL